MGFTTGFTGGVTLTLSLAYLAVHSHQRNRERQSALLRAQTTSVYGLVDPPPALPAPTRAEVAARQRDTFVERIKDGWNAELEGTARWLQTRDWDEIRVDIESAAGRLWAVAFGGGGYPSTEAAAEPSWSVGDVADRAGAEIRRGATMAAGLAGETAESVSAAAKSAFAAANASGIEAQAAAVELGEEAYQDVRAEGATAVAQTEQRAGQATDSVLEAIGRGLEQGKDALGFAQAKALDVGEKIEAKVEEQVSTVEKTMRQRYEGPATTAKSVEEALAERYVPLDQREEAVLRGL